MRPGLGDPTSWVTHTRTWEALVSWPIRGLSLGRQWRMSNLRVRLERGRRELSTDMAVNGRYAVPAQSWSLRGSGACPSCMSCRPSLKTCSI